MGGCQECSAHIVDEGSYRKPLEAAAEAFQRARSLAKLIQAIRSKASDSWWKNFVGKCWASLESESPEPDLPELATVSEPAPRTGLAFTSTIPGSYNSLASSPYPNAWACDSRNATHSYLDTQFDRATDSQWYSSTSNNTECSNPNYRFTYTQCSSSCYSKFSDAINALVVTQHSTRVKLTYAEYEHPASLASGTPYTSWNSVANDARSNACTPGKQSTDAGLLVAYVSSCVTMVCSIAAVPPVNWSA